MLKLLERGVREPAGEYAFRVLHYNILHFLLKPGQPMQEAALSQALGLSRTPVREALGQLSRIYLVEVMPQRGSRVSLLDTRLIDEGRRTRCILECAMMQAVCERATTADLHELEHNLHLQKFYLEQANPEQLIELDNEFHRTFFRIGDSVRTFETMSGFLGQYDVMRCVCLRSVSAQQAVADHELIVEAIKSRNVEVAVREMQHHVARYSADEQRVRAEHPAYFLKTNESK